MTPVELEQMQDVLEELLKLLGEVHEMLKEIRLASTATADGITVEALRLREGKGAPPNGK